MKKYFVLLLLLCATVITLAQNESRDVQIDLDEVGVSPPVFTGIANVNQLQTDDPNEMIRQYLKNNVVYPEKAIKCNRQGTEIIRFVVTPSGDVTDITFANAICPLIDKELVRVMETTNGMWKPGLKDGRPVAMEKEVTLAFCCTMIGNDKTVAEYFTKKAAKQFDVANRKFIENHNPKRALAHYDKGITFKPYDQGLLFMRGLCRYELGDKEGAREDWDRMVSVGGVDLEKYASKTDFFAGYEEVAQLLKEKK